MKNVALFLSFGVFLLFLPAFSARAEEIASLLAPQGALEKNRVVNVSALRSVYETGGFVPIWRLKNPKNREAFLAFLDNMVAFTQDNGLGDHIETIALFKVLAQDAAMAENPVLDVAVTDWVLRLALEMRGLGVSLKKLYPSWPFEREENGSAFVKAYGEALYTQKIYDFLADSGPNSLAYLQLVSALRLYRAVARQQAWAEIDKGPVLSQGAKGSRVQQVRERLEAEAYLLPLCRSEIEAQTFDEELKKVVMDYQSRNGLDATGKVDEPTRTAMNKSVAHRLEQLRANMARLRAMPRSFPTAYAFVNIADASIKLFRDEEMIYYAQVVLGRPSRQTPFIESAIRSIVLNPSWNIPISIARNDILPKVRKEPTYLAKKGYKIKGNHEDPFGERIDWSSVEARALLHKLYQDPGRANALGSIKFDFDNPFSVYLHGTPHKEDFIKARRHLSSGCVRLKDPEKLAALILETNQNNRSIETLKARAGEETMLRVGVENPLPLFIVYQTAFFPSDDISVHFRPDVYGYDARLLSALKAQEVRYAPLFEQEPLRSVAAQ